MATYYLDVDDEITSAAARIRSAEDVDVALVLPAGSRIATSRINFRLLAREAAGRSRRLSIVAPEASARALAAAAGLPSFATLVEYEQAHAAVDPVAAAPVVPPVVGAEEADRSGSGAAGAAAIGAVGVAATRAGANARPGMPDGANARPAAPDGGPGQTPTGTAAGSDAGAPAGAAAVSGAAAARRPADETVRQTGAALPTSRDPGRPPGAIGASTGLGAAQAPPSSRARRRWPVLVAVLLLVVLIAGAGLAAGYVLLPTATVTLKIASEPVGPVVFTGTADPDAVAVDPETATIPAVRVSVPLSATGTFKATGKRVVASKATGQVRWTNCDPTRSYRIPRGTLARTPNGIAFATQETMFLPVAILNPPQIRCQNRTVDVEATRDGPAGNVPAGSITVIPGQYNSVVIKATNLKATSGGAREEFPQITAKDVASATARLTKQLDEQLAAVAGEPPGTPAGAIAYAETAQRSEPVPSEAPADLVGQEVATFDLTLTADGTVVAADPAPLDAIAAARVAAAVPEGMQLREGSVQVTVGDGIAEGELIRYPVEGRAEAVPVVSEDEVRALVKGKTPAQAEEALAQYGAVEVTMWPDWVSTITTVDARLTVVVEGVPPATGTPAPSSGTGSPAVPATPGSPSPGSAPPASPSPSATAAP